MKIYIDADGCPVVKESIKIAQKYKVEIILVSNTSHMWFEDYAQIVTVEKGKDRADFEIVARMSENDIIITQDYGLAAMVLPKTPYVINQNGWIYNKNNIETLLFTRHIAAKERRGGNRSKGPKKRTREQNDIFQSVLEEILIELI